MTYREEEQAQLQQANTEEKVFIRVISGAPLGPSG